MYLNTAKIKLCNHLKTIASVIFIYHLHKTYFTDLSNPKDILLRRRKFNIRPRFLLLGHLNKIVNVLQGYSESMHEGMTPDSPETEVLLNVRGQKITQHTFIYTCLRRI